MAIAGDLLVVARAPTFGTVTTSIEVSERIGGTWTPFQQILAVPVDDDVGDFVRIDGDRILLSKDLGFLTVESTTSGWQVTGDEDVPIPVRGCTLVGDDVLLATMDAVEHFQFDGTDWVQQPPLLTYPIFSSFGLQLDHVGDTLFLTRPQLEGVSTLSLPTTTERIGAIWVPTSSSNLGSSLERPKQSSTVRLSRSLVAATLTPTPRSPTSMCSIRQSLSAMPPSRISSVAGKEGRTFSPGIPPPPQIRSRSGRTINFSTSLRGAASTTTIPSTPSRWFPTLYELRPRHSREPLLRSLLRSASTAPALHRRCRTPWG